MKALPSTSSSVPWSLVLGACALAGSFGCVDLDDSEASTDTAVRSEGPLTTPRGSIAFGQVRTGSTTELGLQLDNTGRSEIVIRQVSIVPPDPYAPAYVPPDPCIPPDPYHNPPGDLTTRLIVPCIKPAGTTTLNVAFAPSEAGGFAAGIRVDYATADGGAYSLTVPATACVAR